MNSLFEPEDAANQLLRSRVAPHDWKNPDPSERYHLVVIGGGSAGLITAAGAAGLGARVALIERHALGGDCLNVGCVPSKALLRSAKAVEAARFGVRSGEPATTDFTQAMEELRALRTRISVADSAERYQNELGVDIYLGHARFTSPHSLKIGEQTLHFKRAVIATGSRPQIPEIPGLRAEALLTNETLFSLTELPERLHILGGGVIGTEMAQAFARFGSEVTVIQRSDRLLPREDPEASALILAQLREEGVDVRLRSTVKTIDATGHVELDSGESLPPGRLLIATGRRPNVESLGLETAGVDYTTHRITVDTQLRTSQRNIFAIGDVALPEKFTHMADASARIVIRNALFRGRQKWTDLVVPRVTYTSPEVAAVGITPIEAERRGVAVEEFTQDFSHLDRAILDREEAGFLKVWVETGTDRIVGATIVAAHAGDLLAPITLAMQNKIGLGQIAQTVFPYPTQSEAFKRVADAYNRTRLTPRIKKLFATWLRWTA